jgi:hypothetical protein
LRSFLYSSRFGLLIVKGQNDVVSVMNIYIKNKLGSQPGLPGPAGSRVDPGFQNYGYNYGTVHANGAQVNYPGWQTWEIAEATKMGDQWLQSRSLLPGNLDCCYFLFFFLVLWLFFFLSSVYQVFSLAKLFTSVFSFQSLRVSSLCVKAFYLHWLESLFKTRKTKLKK